MGAVLIPAKVSNNRKRDFPRCFNFFFCNHAFRHKTRQDKYRDGYGWDQIFGHTIYFVRGVFNCWWRWRSYFRQVRPNLPTFVKVLFFVFVLYFCSLSGVFFFFFFFLFVSLLETKKKGDSVFILNISTYLDFFWFCRLLNPGNNYRFECVLMNWFHLRFDY